MTDNNRKKYKLCAVDMDGTLLTSDNKITAATADAIRAVCQKGIYFCLTTGRPPIAARPFYDSLGLDTPSIIYNGARVIEFRTGKVHYDRMLQSDDAMRIYALGCELDASMCFWSGDKLYANRNDGWNDQYRRISGADMTIPENFEEYAEKGIVKIVWSGLPDSVKRWNAAAAERFGESISYASSGAEYLEFFDRRVSKGAALARLCDILNIDISETIAIGDSYNDEQLLRAAGLGIAMGNAPDAIKDICAEVTTSNDEDGVRLVLEKYFLQVRKKWNL